MTPDDRAQLRALLEEASARPWVARGEWIDGSGYDEVILPARVDCMAYCYGGSSHVEYGTEYDQALIVAAVNALPGLLDALDAAEAGIEQVRALRRPDPTPDDAIAAWLTTPEQAARISPTPDLAELRRLRDTEREELHSPTRRLDAYYYSFNETGSVPIDAILSAVAIAGNAARTWPPFDAAST